MSSLRCAELVFLAQTSGFHDELDDYDLDDLHMEAYPGFCGWSISGSVSIEMGYRKNRRNTSRLR